MLLSALQTEMDEDERAFCDWASFGEESPIRIKGQVRRYWAWTSWRWMPRKFCEIKNETMTDKECHAFCTRMACETPTSVTCAEKQVLIGGKWKTVDHWPY